MFKKIKWVFYFSKCTPNNKGKNTHDNMLSNYTKKKKKMENVFSAYDKVPLMLKGGVRTPWVGGHAQNECMP